MRASQAAPGTPHPSFSPVAQLKLHLNVEPYPHRVAVLFAGFPAFGTWLPVADLAPCDQHPATSNKPPEPKT